MPTWLAAVILLLALAGIVPARKYLHGRRTLQILCIVDQDCSNPVDCSPPAP